VQPDGAFLYFAGAPSDDPLHQFRIWRARGDGSSPEPLPGIPEVAAGYAVPSPDGHTLIYAELLGSGTLHMYDLVAMAPLPFQRPGHSPSWSPDGRRIAYWQDGEIYLMDPDGSNTTALTAAGPAASVNLGFDWSGDGHWLVVTASASGRLTLIETSTGLALPLPPLDFGLEWPSWRH
ncbi:MAG TPA: hypothetical protein VFU23_16930, partial [Gemmatimonadales bacterium]|nr:hypothetical protein [Gemmatimonadales bacterium]